MRITHDKVDRRDDAVDDQHTSFTSSRNSLMVSCARIRTASITWISRTAQSRFIPVPTGSRSRNATHSNVRQTISSRYDYQPNDQVLVLVYKPDKLEPCARGPYRILHTHVNGTVMIRRSPTVTERINIRRLRPYRQ